MQRVLTAAALRKIRPHDLRHTVATLAIQAGVKLLNVSRQLQNASIAIPTDVCTHAVPRGNRAAADLMEAFRTGQKSNQVQPPRNLTT